MTMWEHKEFKEFEQEEKQKFECPMCGIIEDHEGLCEVCQDEMSKTTEGW